MDSELFNFIKVWITAITSLVYCYYVVSLIPRGIIRLLSLLPIIYLFCILPLNISSFNLCGPTIFYLVWLGNFKLILFSFGQGPLSPQPPLSLLHFISVALFPIKTKQDPSPKSHPNAQKNTDPSLKSSQNAKTSSDPSLKSPQNAKRSSDPSLQSPATAKSNKNPSANSNSSPDPDSKFDKSLGRKALFVLKVVLLAVIIRVYDYRQDLHPYVILALYCCHLYLAVELVLAITAAPLRAILGFEIEPQFNEPYLATSLQDFWGRRWNLMVTSILRPTVFYRVRRISTRVVGKLWGLQVAYLASFLVSGLMHEIIYFYLTRVSPTWEVTWFFVLHGVCTGVEVAAKTAVNGRFRLHRAVSGPLTLAFVAVTGAWLFFPQIIRNGVDLKVIREYEELVSFVREKLSFNF
ncbi:unnamed protein product [Ilex paraguariensis]|uniref:Wax synthase domain-containing protein n=1 Tax=Ilex paraguariensis TaxID=185542 RepID=A0ABC8TDB2_9AQUA